MLGATRGLILYVASGSIAAAAQCYQGLATRTNVQCIGASGAVSAFLTYSILLHPSRIIYVNLFLPVPAFLFGIFYILNDAYGASGHPRYTQGVAVGHEAHLVGSAVGAATFVLTRGRRRMLW